MVFFFFFVGFWEVGGVDHSNVTLEAIWVYESDNSSRVLAFGFVVKKDGWKGNEFNDNKEDQLVDQCVWKLQFPCMSRKRHPNINKLNLKIGRKKKKKNFWFVLR